MGSPWTSFRGPSPKSFEDSFRLLVHHGKLGLELLFWCSFDLKKIHLVCRDLEHWTLSAVCPVQSSELRYTVMETPSESPAMYPKVYHSEQWRPSSYVWIALSKSYADLSLYQALNVMPHHISLVTEVFRQPSLCECFQRCSKTLNAAEGSGQC